MRISHLCLGAALLSLLGLPAGASPLDPMYDFRNREYAVWGSHASHTVTGYGQTMSFQVLTTVSALGRAGFGPYLFWDDRDGYGAKGDFGYEDDEAARRG